MRSNLVEQAADGSTTIVGIAPGCWPEASDPAQRGRHPDRALRIFSNSKRCHACGYRHCSSSAAAARNPRQVAGIAHCSIGHIAAGPAKRKLMQICLAQHDSSRLPQPGNNRRVFGRAKFSQRRRSCRRWQVGGIDAVFDRNRKPMQRSQFFACRPARVRSPRCGANRFGLERDESVEVRSIGASRQQGLGISESSNLPGAHR